MGDSRRSTGRLVVTRLSGVGRLCRLNADSEGTESYNARTVPAPPSNDDSGASPVGVVITEENRGRVFAYQINA